MTPRDAWNLCATSAISAELFDVWHTDMVKSFHMGDIKYIVKVNDALFLFLAGKYKDFRPQTGLYAYRMHTRMYKLPFDKRGVEWYWT